MVFQCVGIIVHMSYITIQSIGELVGAFGKLWVRNSLMPRGGIKIQGTLCMREIYRWTENLKIKLYKKKDLCIIYCSIYQYQVSQVVPNLIYSNPRFENYLVKFPLSSAPA